MKSFGKNISSILFLLLGAAPLLFILFFSVKQHSIRNKMKVKLEQQSLYTVAVADDEIFWIKKGEEIFVNGKMFDIKSIEHKNGFVIFHGLYDMEETTLNKNFNEGWEKNQSMQNQLVEQFFQILQEVYYSNGNLDIHITDRNPFLISRSCPKTRSQFLAIPTPPPQV